MFLRRLVLLSSGKASGVLESSARLCTLPTTVERRDSKSLMEPQGATEMDEFAPYLAPTFNLAAYANKSASLKRFLELGVDLYKIEKRKGLGQLLLQLDFDRDCKEHLLFLKDNGVPPEEFGKFITKNPAIFKETLDDLQVRVNYLESKRFTPEMISRIILVNPYWLNFSTKRIDARLGYFQKAFQLKGHEVRLLAAKQPRLITYKIEHVERNTFTVREEQGFEQEEVKSLLLAKPRIFMLNNEELQNRFDYVHRTMGLSHKDILQFPEVLTTKQFKIRQRHQFLETLGRAQYDPKKELFVPPSQLATLPDKEFVEELAKSTLEDYDKFLKTL